jgi:hypothetical protein
MSAMQADPFTSPPEPEAAPSATDAGSSSRAVSKAQELGTSQLTTQKQTLAQALQSAGSALRQGSQSLQGEGQQGLSQVAEMGAERAERLSTYLRDTEPTELISRVRETARQQPVLVAGGAFVVALLGARLLRSLTPPPPAAGPEPPPDAVAGGASDAASLNAVPAGDLATEPTPTDVEGLPRPRRPRGTPAAPEATGSEGSQIPPTEF